MMSQRDQNTRSCSSALQAAFGCHGFYNTFLSPKARQAVQDGTVELKVLKTSCCLDFMALLFAGCEVRCSWVGC